MAAMDDLIITADDTFFIEGFEGEGWNASRKHRIAGIGSEADLALREWRVRNN